MINAIGILTGSTIGLGERAAASLQANYLYGVESYAIATSEIKTYVEKGYVNAFKWEEGHFVKCQTDLPKYIDIPWSVSRIRREKPEIYFWLRENTTIIDEQAIDKYHLQRGLLTSEISANAIPTFPLTGYDTLLKLLDVIPKAIVKPVGGTKASGLMSVDKVGDEIRYATRQGQGILTEEVFSQYSDALKNKSTLLFEPRLNILNNAGRAVDFRCLVSRNGDAEWQNVLTYARIGGSNVASNFSDGGSLNYADEVLEQLVPGQAKEKLEEINALALNVARFIENNSSIPCCRLGIDICIHRDTNRVHVIEANSKPGVKFVGPWPLSLVMAQYYKFILENGVLKK